MKLVEILAEKMNVWPETTVYYAQDSCGLIFPWTLKPKFCGEEWVGYCDDDEENIGIDYNWEAAVHSSHLASDWDEALVTKEMWLAEKGKKGCDDTQTHSTGGGAMTGHIHAENMKLYAEDAAETEKPWERWQTRVEGVGDWVPLAVPAVWHTGKEYRRKPTTITIGGEEVPEPVREPLERGESYWVASTERADFAYFSRWDNDIIDMKRLRFGLIHRTKKAAVAHTKALIRVSGGEV